MANIRDSNSAEALDPASCDSRPEVQDLFGRLQSSLPDLENLLRQCDSHAWFLTIVRDGTGKAFEPCHNRRWLEVTRPIVEASFHARYFLEMAVRYGKVLQQPPRNLPSGWAALLHLFDLR